MSSPVHETSSAAKSVDDQPMNNDLVILYGSGRSGTSWLHLLIGAHPHVVTGQQSRVFSRYLQPLYERWRTELAHAREGTGRIHGITSFVSEEMVLHRIREIASDVFAAVEPLKTSAHLTLENQPGDAASLPLITKCFPNVKLIHSIRDGRDAALSLYLGYERFDLPDLATAARWWRDRTALGLEAKNLGVPYCEVRYEDLQNDAPGELKRIFEFLDVPSTPDQLQEICDEYQFDRVKKRLHTSPFVNPGLVEASGTASRPEPKGFFRSGKSRQWQDMLNRRDIKIIQGIAGELLNQLSYDLADPSTFPRGRKSLEPAGERILLALGRLERGAKTCLRQAFEKITKPRRRN